MDLIASILARLTAAFAFLPPWGRAAVVLAAVAALVRANLKPGAALFSGAVLLAIAFNQDLEPFANALNQGVTGLPTIRLFLSLGALAWLGEVLKEGGAARRIRSGLSGVSDPSVRGILGSLLEGLLPGERPAGWFPRLAPLALPVGAGFVVASSLAQPLTPSRASALLLPLALAMAAVGLWLAARSPVAAPDGEKDGPGGLPDALIPVLLFLALAFALPEPRIPEARATSPLPRLFEGLAGLLHPVALGAAAAALVASRLLGVGWGACRLAFGRSFGMDLAILAVGLRLFMQVAQARIPMLDGGAAASAADSLRTLAPVLGSTAGLCAAVLLLPGLAAWAMRGAAEGFAASLPFLLPMAGQGEGQARLAALAFAGAWLGETLEKEGKRVLLPVLLTGLLAGLLALAP